MDFEDWQRIHDRLDQAHKASIGLGLGTKEFWTWHRAVYSRLQQANSEWVICRRKGRATPRYVRLLEEAEETLKNFESYILIAKLMQRT
jgi:hypothetical protein